MTQYTFLRFRLTTSTILLLTLLCLKEENVQGMMDNQFQLEEFKLFLDTYGSGLPDSMQRRLASRYAELFSIFYERREKIARVTLWGLHDGMSWRNDYPIPRRTNIRCCGIGACTPNQHCRRF